MSAEADIYPNKNFGFRPKSHPVVAFGVKSKFFILFGGAGDGSPWVGSFCLRGYAAQRRAAPCKNNRAAIVPKLVSRQGGTFGVAELNLIDGSLPRELNASRKAKREAVQGLSRAFACLLLQGEPVSTPAQAQTFQGSRGLSRALKNSPLDCFLPPLAAVLFSSPMVHFSERFI